MALVIKAVLLIPVFVAAFSVGAYAGASGHARGAEAAAVMLAPSRALGVSVDTFFIGGYGRGRYSEALRGLAADLGVDERETVGQHLDKIFAAVNDRDGLGAGGRLRVAYERALRPDGSTRSVRVLTAEAAVAGMVHTAYYFERDGSPGYYDADGRSLEGVAMARPLPSSRVSSPFGSQRLHPILQRVLPHLGVDYAAASGSPVRASADGTVIAAERRGGYGNLVEVQHPNGYSTRYAHLAGFGPGVQRGVWVRQGQVIGYVGMTGLATGPHLHYEVRRHGRPVDPLRVFEGRLHAAEELQYDPRWFEERQRLAGLLSRVPTLGAANGPGY